MNPFDRCVRCQQAPPDHLHLPVCDQGNQARHHIFAPDAKVIAAELRRIAPRLSKEAAFELVAAIVPPSPVAPPRRTPGPSSKRTSRKMTC